MRVEHSLSALVSIDVAGVSGVSLAGRAFMGLPRHGIKGPQGGFGLVVSTGPKEKGRVVATV